LKRWISVEERLPKECIGYLCYDSDFDIEVLIFDPDDKIWENDYYSNIEVTHWMPLPAPPEEK